MMNSIAVEQRIGDVIREVLGDGVDSARLDPKTPLKNVTVLDSLSMLRLMVAIEAEFKLKFDAADLERAFHSIETLSRHIEARTLTRPAR